MIYEIERMYIATPCAADWDEMDGDERQRLCGLCRKNVYNASEMSRKELNELIIKTEGKFCAQIYRRSDGTIITDDCPKGLRRVRNAARKALKWTAAISALLLASLPALAQSAKDEPSKKKDGKGKTTILMDTTCSSSDKKSPSDQPRLVKGEMVAAPPAVMRGKVAVSRAPSPQVSAYIESSIQQINAQWLKEEGGKAGPIMLITLTAEGKLAGSSISVSSGDLLVDTKALNMLRNMKFSAPTQAADYSNLRVDLHTVHSKNQEKGK
ncbi:MAG: TonB family protein [Candidatus Obscuribacterales bacterium]|nr:TonB family protein [Candidatus Obscuribacterales bacterium]